MGTPRLQPGLWSYAAAALRSSRTAQWMHRWLDGLPEHERDVLELCAWSGLDYEATAAALDIPVGTVRSRLSRARAHLRELLDKNGHELDRDVVSR